MLCERCGGAPASSRVTEIVNGAVHELSLCADCARPLGMQEEEALRCRKCGTLFDEKELRRIISSVKVGPEGWTRDFWKELETLTACPICGERLGLPYFPVELLQDPSIQLELALIARLRPRSGGPESFQ